MATKLTPEIMISLAFSALQIAHALDESNSTVAYALRVLSCAARDQTAGQWHDAFVDGEPAN